MCSEILRVHMESFDHLPLWLGLRDSKILYEMMWELNQSMVNPHCSFNLVREVSLDYTEQ